MDSINRLFSLLPKDIIDRISGKLLGDGNISLQTNRRPRFRFSHCLKDVGWTEHCYLDLKDYIPLNKPKARKVLDK